MGHIILIKLLNTLAIFCLVFQPFLDNFLFILKVIYIMYRVEEKYYLYTFFNVTLSNKTFFFNIKY